MNWTAVASLIAALAAASGVAFTGLSWQTTRAQNAVTEQGQITDRYGKAIDQLDRTGPEHLQGRLGAIYALERLARDSSLDQPTIVEVLSAFIRTTAGPPTPESADFREVGRCPGRLVAPDVQATLIVLGRRDISHDKTTRVDLHGTCLTGADLSGVNLSGVNLGGATLNEVDLFDANLRGTNLSGVDLTEAGLSGADLRGAILGSANLTDAYLISTDLSGADLRGTILKGANLEDANLSGAVHDAMTVVTNVAINPNTEGVWW